MDDQTIYHIRERLLHRLNRATLLTNFPGDNVGVYIDIDTWREIDNILQEMDEL